MKKPHIAKHLVTVKTFTEPTIAYIYQGKLKTKKIKSYIKNSEIITMNPLYSNAYGGVKSQVNETDVAKARQIISKIEDKGKIRKTSMLPRKTANKKCPNCNSTNISKEKISKSAFALGILFLGFPLLFFQKKYHCFKCKYEWKN